MLPPCSKATASLLHVSTTVVSAECVAAHSKANPLPVLTVSALGRVVVNTVLSERENTILHYAISKKMCSYGI